MYMLFMCILFMSTLTTKQTSILSFLQENKIASTTMLTNKIIDVTDIDAGAGAGKIGEQGYDEDAEAAHEDKKP